MRGQAMPGAARFLTAGRGITMPEPGRTTVPYWVTTEAEGAQGGAGARGAQGRHRQDLGGQPGRQVQEADARALRRHHRRGAQERAPRHRAHLRARGREGAAPGRASTRSRTACATGTSTTSSWRCSSSGRTWSSRRTCRDRGVKTDSSWLQAEPAGRGVAKLEAANTDRPEAQALFGIQARNLAKLNAAGVRIALGTDGNTPVGPARGDGGHGGGRHDAGAGHRRGDAELGGVPAAGRRRHAARPARAPTSSCSTPIRWTTSPTRGALLPVVLRGAAVTPYFRRSSMTLPSFGSAAGRDQLDLAAQLRDVADRGDDCFTEIRRRLCTSHFQRHAVVAGLAFDHQAGTRNFGVVPQRCRRSAAASRTWRAPWCSGPRVPSSP